MFIQLDKQSPIVTKLYSLFAPTNTIEQAKRNVSAHYDVSNEMFATFLSPDMTYSCPLWLPPQDIEYKHDDLEKAQQRKLLYHIKAARIKSSDHVLEIGTGWGSFAIQAVRETGCTLTTVTLSTEQKALAEKRIDAAGLADKITVLLCDFREIPKLTAGRRFDKVVSIEMLEHTGIEYLHEYFGVIKDLLMEEGAIATFQIYPGGYLPTLTEAIKAINKGAGDHFIIDRIENFGGLGRAFQAWGKTFDRDFDSRIRPDMVTRNPQCCDTEIEEFRRKWRASIYSSVTN
ncbi:cyclopropane-fatty-acyl-phospholipid synthase [Purpureocillium lilacinum]|uniref:Cyclopropane-fatty-acyl-phospholipid synthase n=1 Tax=Purpureocillium lilacinum TaxID=33203 RepID=A0A179GJL7_PURLI|nr:cyclopropane-fatty-acyl-phospholipid synthase [Purpureocillium lilacinum]OAQ78002.1 cyclopropane-fatty-acyl-phospholipid synthase [Purpureocillium lilacinum]